MRSPKPRPSSSHCSRTSVSAWPCSASSSSSTVHAAAAQAKGEAAGAAQRGACGAARVLRVDVVGVDLDEQVRLAKDAGLPRGERAVRVDVSKGVDIGVRSEE